MNAPFRLLLLKSAQFAHTGKYALYGNPPRWHLVHANKPAPKGAPIAGVPHAAGQHLPATLQPDEIELLKYPADKAAKNAEMAAFNDKHLPELLQHAANGDATAILGSSFGVNSHGKKKALAANALLHLMGSPHKVAPGQKAGEHAAVQGQAVQAPESAKDEALQAAVDHLKEDASQGDLPAAEKKEDAALVEKLEAAKEAEPVTVVPATPEVEHPIPAPASTLTMPAFAGGSVGQSVIDYYEKQAQKVLDLAAAGDVAGLKPNSKGKVSNTWAGKTPNSKLFLDLHAKALEQAKQGAKPSANQEPVKNENPAPAPVSEPSAAPEAPPIKKQPRLVIPTKAPRQKPAGNSLLVQIPWDTFKVPDTNTNASSHNPTVDKIKAMAEAGDLAGLEAFHGKKAGAKQTYAVKQAKLAALAIAALKEGAPAAQEEVPPPVTAEDEAAVAAMKEEKLQSTSAHEYIAGQLKVGGFADAAAKEWLDANVTGHAEVDAALKDLGYEHLANFSKTPEGAGDFLNAIFNYQPLEDDDGPKDGDTKPAADGGVLVLKDGHWVKQEVEPAAPAQAAPAAPSIPEPPQFSGVGGNPVWAERYGKVAAALHAKVLAGGAAALKGVVVNHSDGTFSITAAGFKLKKVGPGDKPEYRKQMHAYITALKAAVGKPAKVKKEKAAPAASPQAQTAVATPGTTPMDSWVQTGPQGGSNPGGRFKDENGVEWYCKFPSDPDIAKSEVLAAKLYEAMGIAAQDAKLVTKGGKVGIASRWVGVSKAPTPKALAGTDGVAAGFGADAWLANWDVVGMGFDNLQVGADGKAMRVDAGGSLEYRAQGGKKAFGNIVTEIDSLRDPKINAQAAAVFGGLTDADITASVAKVLALPDSTIFDLVMEHGPGSVDDKANMIDTLMARKADLAAKFPKAKKKEKPKPDPTKLKVDASQLATMHDYANWNGPGKGLSSKAHVNEANQKAEQDLLNAALQGNLVALQDYHFEAIDKETGASQGLKHIQQHPSQNVKGYWSDLVATLSYIAYPPEALKRFSTVVATSVKKVSDAFKSHAYGMTTNKAEANSRLAFWIAIGQTKPAINLLPPGASTEFQSAPTGTPKMTTAMKQAAQSAYAALGPGRLVRRFINGIQSSGSYNNNFRDGLLKTSDGYDAVAMVKDAYDFATEKPEGFEVYKWVSFPKDMAQQMINAPAGTVFQNPGSMCCSYNPTSTAGFGPDRIRIRFAKGAKGVDSFGSGNFSSEYEITTLPGQRFVILSCKKVQCPIKGKERTELDVMMLPPDPSYLAELDAMKGSK